MGSRKDKKKSGNATETTPKLSLSVKKTPNSDKPEFKVVHKSLDQNSARGKEVKTSQIQARTEGKRTKNLNSHHGNQEKGISTLASGENKEKSGNPSEKIRNSLKPKHKIVKNKIKSGKQERHTSERDDKRNLNSHYKEKGKEFLDGKRDGKKSEEDVCGLIFMCNTKTKPDCFRYQVMAVPTNKQQTVMGIKPGIKLFLFDFDVKLLYGIYVASSAGGMKLEPAAFGGAFPVQVRFKVFKDCLPLPLSVFKKAIKDIYDERTRKFKTELSAQQVKKLTSLFQPASYLLPNAQSSSFQEPIADPNFYQPPIKPDEEAHEKRSVKDPYISIKSERSLNPSDHEMKQFSEQPNYPAGNKSSPLFLTEKEYRNYGLRGESQNKSAVPLGHNTDPHDAFLTEKEYRTHGLRGRYEQTSSISPSIQNNYRSDPYDPYNESTTSLVDRYLSLPAPSEIYVNGYSNYIDSGINYQGRLVPDEREILYTRYPSSSTVLAGDYNEKYHNLGGETTEAKSAPVSARYSFAGPSVSYPYRR